MENYKLKRCIYFVVFTLLVSGCMKEVVSSAIKQENSSSLVQNTSQNIAESSANNSQSETSGNIHPENIKEFAQDIVNNHKILEQSSQEYLKSKDNQNCGDCSDIAIIAAASCYIANNKEQASHWGKKAYLLAPQQQIPLLLDTNVISTDDRFENQQKLAEVKDFIISCNNQGIESFKNGELNFMGYAKYKDAIELYKKALQEGISDSQVRKECYLHLSISMYHSNQKEQARKLIIYTWLVYPDLVIDVGEQATRDVLQNYINEYKKNRV